MIGCEAASHLIPAVARLLYPHLCSLILTADDGACVCGWVVSNELFMSALETRPHSDTLSVSADIHNKKSILGLRGSFSAEFVVGTTSVVWISHM